jgi:hypothetical protein
MRHVSVDAVLYGMLHEIPPRMWQSPSKDLSQAATTKPVNGGYTFAKWCRYAAVIESREFEMVFAAVIWSSIPSRRQKERTYPLFQ